ncbi:TPA: asparagine synthase [Candidatus Bathyarchaeota archaeon]|nr:asparagine synthase [Candidatus Bathyarchaeota archaeon]
MKNNLAEGILLSGGLDTSILAVVASRFTSLKAFTIAFKGVPAPDVKYAVLIAKKLGFMHHVHIFDEDELYDAIPQVVKTTKSFDPMEIRNSVAIYIGLRVAGENGISTVMTGDGCDELFAGYSFLFGLEREKLDLELRRLWSVMAFSSVPLANVLGIEAKLPYLDPDFKNYAMKLDSRYKVQTENRSMYGKWILRKAFENLLPREIVWRAKTPIEYGSGTTTLPNLFNRKISDEEFEEKRGKYLAEDGVIIRDKEQLFYYEFYRSLIGVPNPSGDGSKVCPYCRSDVPEKATYCRTCGAYPI